MSSIQLYETNSNGDFQEVSLLESTARITCIPQASHVVSVMLLDMSNSIRRGYGALDRLKEMAIGYLNGLSGDVSSHVVAVYTFDGTRDVRLLQNFGSPSAAIAAINALNCGNDRCTDPSTNLNGAVVYANRVLVGYMSANGFAADGVARQPYIAAFTDGADQAQWFTDAEAQAAGRNGTGIFAVGLQGEVRAGNYRRGVDVARLEALAPGGVFILDSAIDLQNTFSSLSTAISAAAASSYRLDYCSPKRRGVHTIRVEISHFGAKTHWEHSFDTITFDCDANGCDSCLGGVVTETFSCAFQPGPEYQAFKCDAGQLPVTVDGYCRCPCTNSLSYPDASVIGPGPILCERQGTCADPDRITCSNHGGIAPTTEPFTRFGVADNSRISMEFTPTCSDGWPLPGLRMSSCSALTDFTVYEGDAVSGFQKIDIFEAEPRVMCFPDVVSLILLDTSGSIRAGSGVAALRDAVLKYIQELQALSVQHSVAIYAFDGRTRIQQIIGFTTNMNVVLTANVEAEMEEVVVLEQDDSDYVSSVNSDGSEAGDALSLDDTEVAAAAIQDEGAAPEEREDENEMDDEGSEAAEKEESNEADDADAEEEPAVPPAKKARLEALDHTSPTSLARLLRDPVPPTPRTIVVKGDSELVIGQIKGTKTCNETLRRNYDQAQNLLAKLHDRRTTIEPVHIPRELNKDADELSNRAMDTAHRQAAQAYSDSATAKGWAMRTALSRLGKIARVKAVHPALEMRVNHLTSLGGPILQGLNKRPQINNREAFEAVMRAFEVAAVRHVPKKMANKGRGDQGGHWEKAGVLTGSFRPQAHYPRGWQHSGEKWKARARHDRATHRRARGGGSRHLWDVLANAEKKKADAQRAGCRPGSSTNRPTAAAAAATAAATSTAATSRGRTEGPAAQHQSIPHAGGDGRETLPRDDEGRGEPGAVK
ncbi:hypothetical protein DIPPA_06355 [Diplonema papillatum]|nr:hypothetical protein DIPPA_06355 [Diplonema papillatum]